MSGGRFLQAQDFAEMDHQVDSADNTGQPPLVGHQDAVQLDLP